MARLIACPSCRRHVLATEHDCPFCGHVGLTTAAPGRLSVLLLGLCLAGCAGAKDDGKVDAKTDAKADAKTDAKVDEKTDTPEPEPEPEPEPNDTAVAPPEQPEQPEGADGGAAIDEPPKIDNPPMKTKYGGPRPAKKYGAPPRPDTLPG